MTYDRFFVKKAKADLTLFRRDDPVDEEGDIREPRLAVDSKSVPLVFNQEQ